MHFMIIYKTARQSSVPMRWLLEITALHGLTVLLECFTDCLLVWYINHYYSLAPGEGEELCTSTIVIASNVDY